MLSVTNLTFKVHNKIIFNNISSIFNNGEIIGITGAAGSGKRTFINLLCSKKRKYQGIISIDDCNIENISKRNYNKLVSHYSSSQETINPEAVVKEWILGGRIIHKRILSPYTDLDREIAYREMINFGLEEFAETRLKMISETSRQMASMARVHSAQSGILLLEKPEAGLNINQKVLLTNALKKYTLSGNNIVILTSADLNFLSASCDRIIILADKTIAESGSHRMITSDLIKKYFNTEAIVTKNIYTGLPEIQIIEEN